MNSAEGFDRFHAQIGTGAGRQITIGNGQQLAEGIAVRGHANLIDHQRHHQRVHMVEQFEQDLAPSRRAARRHLPDHAVLRSPWKILYPVGQKNHDRLRVEFAQQPGHLHGFRNGPSAHCASQVLQGLFAEISSQIGNMLGVIAQAAAIETRSQLLHGGLRQLPQNVRQPRGYLARPQGFLDKLRNALFYAHLRAQTARNSRPLGFYAENQIQRLLHGGETAAGGRLLAQANESSADEPLQLGVLFHAEAQAKMPQRFAQQIRIGLAV